MNKKIATAEDLTTLRDSVNALIDTWGGALPDADTPPDPHPVPGTAWLSGVSDGPDIINQWKSFRGNSTTYARSWADQDQSAMDSMTALDDVTKGGYSEVFDLACGGPSDWADAAQGGYDGKWIGQCRKAFQFYRNLKRLDLSMAHEFNGGWYRWSVSPGEQADFRRAWVRWYQIVQDELVRKGKNTTVVLPFNSDTTQGFTIRAGLPDPRYFDIIGCDFYSMWPGLSSQKIWDDNAWTMKGDVPRGILAWLKFAKDLGKPIQFGEWGLNPNQKNNPVDNPFFIQKMHDTFQSIAPADPYNPGDGELAGEAYFNNYLTNGRFFPDGNSAPQSKVLYRKLFGA